MTEETEQPSDGGPAFPAMLPGGNYCTPGMTLRDWFAGQALAGLIASQGGEGCIQDQASWADQYGMAAFEIADEMLKARCSND